MLTYAQNFEDVMLERLFKEVQSGFYVDVGAWDPTVHSVTRHFYDRGWRGVNVEPISQRCQLFDAERPRDINLNKAIGPQPGSMVFFECLEESYLSTLDPDVALAMRDRGLTVEEHTVEVVTLADIFETHCPETVDFLKIDVEGFEGELLKSFDLTRHRPRCLVVEATIPATAPDSLDHLDEIGTWQGWESGVLAQGYRLVHFDGLNRFYLRSEDADLAGRLALPPCIFDEIEHAPIVEQIKGLMDDRSAKEAVIGRLEQELEEVRSDRSAKEAVIGRLERELEEVRSDRSAKEEVISRLGRDLEEVRSDRSAKEEVISRLGRDLEEVRGDRSAKQEIIDRLSQDCERLNRDYDQRGQELALAQADNAAKQSAVERLTAELDEQARKVRELEGLCHTSIGRTNDLARRLHRKDQVLALTSSSLVDYRSMFGGALDLAYRSRRVPGRLTDGGRYVGSPRADSAARRRIGMDVMSIQFGVSGGVEVYMRTLVQALMTLEGIGVVLLCLESQLESLRKTFGQEVAYYVYGSRPVLRSAKRLDARVHRRADVETVERVPASFARLREDAGVQILHCPVQCYSLFDFSVPAVFHLHDLQHLHFPENFRPSDVEARNHYYGLSADLSDIVVATSDYIRDDIVSKMHVPSEKVVRIPATWDPKVEAGLASFSPEDARRTYRLPPLFGLFPAQFWPHKNHARLVEALAIVRSRLPDVDFKLVFTGNRAHSGWPKVAETIERLGLQDHVICLDYVPVGHLAALYKCAAFCVMPSTFEASSYPVIEAQLFGCPSMCSNVTSLPELMRDGAGLLFDAYDAEDMAAQMLRWLRDPDDAAAHAARAAVKVRREHGMDSYAAGIADVYQRMVPL